MEQGHRIFATNSVSEMVEGQRTRSHWSRSQLAGLHYITTGARKMTCRTTTSDVSTQLNERRLSVTTVHVKLACFGTPSWISVTKSSRDALPPKLRDHLLLTVQIHLPAQKDNIAEIHFRFRRNCRSIYVILMGFINGDNRVWLWGHWLIPGHKSGTSDNHTYFL